MVSPKSMNVVFRCDASLVIGSGHVMRCLTLADALREKGCTCQFVCRNHPSNLSALIQEKGYRVTLLPLQEFQVEPYPHHASWVGADWQTDAKETGALIATLETPPDWLVVDHYGLDARWETNLRTAVGRIFVIDDLADRPHDCDLLLDQNLVAGSDQRYDTLVSENCTKLLGPMYALLQPEYAELRAQTKPRKRPVKHIFVYFGGADSDNLTGKTIQALIKINKKDVIINIVASAAGTFQDENKRLIMARANYVMHENLPSLAPLISSSDICIGAGGSTSWERCCLGLPSIVITLADNQIPVAEELDKRKLIWWLGHKDKVTVDQIGICIEEKIKSIEISDYSRRGYQLVEGTGSDAICDRIVRGS